MMNQRSDPNTVSVSDANTLGRLYDVAILGAGIGGSMLAAILSRHGLSVLLIEAESHPHFAIGESTSPEMAGLLRVIGARYSVPEIAHLANFQSVRHNVSSACGVKRATSFVYHREGEAQKPQESTQFPTLGPPMGPDSHWFRQDIDSYVFTAAIRYGTTARQNLRITAFDRVNEIWQLSSEKGEQFKARYLVDGGGIRSPLAQAFGLRDDPPRQRTNSRSMFTHMIGVRPYDQCVTDIGAFGLSCPFHQSTIHHIFDGGWLWIIPFDNHPDSTNPLCSVGLQIDRRKIPDSTLSPDEEFKAFLKRFPSIAIQFEHARPVREWIRSTERIQFSSRQILGDGYCLLPHAAGFIDPLFGSALSITAAFVSGLASRLILAKRDNDFSAERFAPLQSWMQHNQNHFDRLVCCAYDSWADFRLWNAWFRIWVLGNFFGTYGPIALLIRYAKTGDPRQLALMEETPYRGVAGNELDLFTPLFDSAAKYVEAFRAGEITALQASDRIFAMLATADFIPPQLRLADPTRRRLSTFTSLSLLRLYVWGRFRAPESLRKRQSIFDVSALPYMGQTIRQFVAEARRSLRTLLANSRDHVRTWNTEWKHERHNPPKAAVPIAHIIEEVPLPR